MNVFGLLELRCHGHGRNLNGAPLAMTTEVEKQCCEGGEDDAYAEFEYQLLVEALAKELEIVKVK